MMTRTMSSDSHVQEEGTTKYLPLVINHRHARLTCCITSVSIPRRRRLCCGHMLCMVCCMIDSTVQQSKGHHWVVAQHQKQLGPCI